MAEWEIVMEKKEIRIDNWDEFVPDGITIVDNVFVYTNILSIRTITCDYCGGGCESRLVETETIRYHNGILDCELLHKKL